MKTKAPMFIVSGVAIAALAAWAEPNIVGRGEGRIDQQGFAGRVAGMPGGQGGFNREEIFKHVLENPELAKRLGVTEEQVKKIKESQFTLEKQMITMRADAEAAKLEVRHLMEGDKVDRDAIGKAIDAAAAKEATLRKTEILRMIDVKEILGSDTIKKIKDTVRERMAERMRQSGATGNAHPWLQQFRRGEGQPQRGSPQGATPRDGGDKLMRPPQS